MNRLYVSAGAVGTLLFCMQQYAPGSVMEMAQPIEHQAINLLLYPAKKIAGTIEEHLTLQPDQTGWPVKHTQVYFQDSDKDGFGNPDISTSGALPPEGFVINAGDCDDTNADLTPHTQWYLDEDGDGYYVGEAVVQCAAPGVGYRYQGLKGPGDCNDYNEQTDPGAEEIPCNYEDDNCNGFYDEPAPGNQPVMEYYDQDEDGFGTGTGYLTFCPSKSGAWKTGDCDDNDPDIHPGAVERCNGKDDDCDGEVDEGLDGVDEVTWYLDADGDGYGDPNTSTRTCLQQVGYVLDNTDVNDNDATVWQSGLFYADQDGDSYTVAYAAKLAWGDEVPRGYASEASTQIDCDDGTVDIHPNAVEVCNGMDDNCNGLIDEACIPGHAVTSFSLINSSGNQDLGELADGSIIDLSQIPGGRINIRANTNTGVVGSVLLQLSGPRNRKRVATKAPFCLLPNNASPFLGWAPETGTYILTATPYFQSKGKSIAGTPAPIQFTVVAQGQKIPGVAASGQGVNPPAKLPEEGTSSKPWPLSRGSMEVRTLPNPTRGDASLIFTVPKPMRVQAMLFDVSGKLVQHIYTGVADAGIQHQRTVFISRLASGIYFCRITTQDGRVMVQKIVRQ